MDKRKGFQIIFSGALAGLALACSTAVGVFSQDQPPLPKPWEPVATTPKPYQPGPVRGRYKLIPVPDMRDKAKPAPVQTTKAVPATSPVGKPGTKASAELKIPAQTPSASSWKKPVSRRPKAETASSVKTSSRHASVRNRAEAPVQTARIQTHAAAANSAPRIAVIVKKSQAQAPATVKPQDAAANATVNKPVPPKAAVKQAEAIAKKAQPAKPARMVKTAGKPKAAGSYLAAVSAAFGFAGKLIFVLAIAYLSIAAMKFLWNRSGRPLAFKQRAMNVEESLPLGQGAMVHLVRIGSKRCLVGTAHGHVNILSEIDEAVTETLEKSPNRSRAADQTIAQTPTAEKEPVKAAPAKLIGVTSLSALASKVWNPRSVPSDPPAAEVSHQLRTGAQFIDEIRSRLERKD